MVKQEPNLEERIWKKEYPILKPTEILTLTGILKPTTGTGILRPNLEL